MFALSSPPKRRLARFSPRVPGTRRVRWTAALLCLVLVWSALVGTALAQTTPAPAQPAPAQPAPAQPAPAQPAPASPQPGTDAPADAPADGDAPADPNADPNAPPASDDPDQVALPRLPDTDMEAAQGLPVQVIEITGLRRIAPTDVQGYMKLKAGLPFDAGDLRRDVRAIWRSGSFEDLEVDLRVTSAGVSLRLHVKERATVSALEFDGNEEIDDDDLTEALEVKVDSVLSRPALGRAVQKIRDMYAEKGYFLAEARFEIVQGRNNTVTVKFIVKENTQVTVKRVTFIGNRGISTAELKGLMLTGNPGIMGFGSGGPFRQDMFERDIAMISATYYDRGYLQVSVSTPRVMLTPDKSGIEVSITIDEGPRFKIRQLRVFEMGPDGQEVEPIGGRRALRLMVRAESGDYFNRAQLLEDIGLIRSLYRDEGYANVLAEPQTQVDAMTREVDVVIPVVRGPVVYFERIEMRGNPKTRDRVIRRELEIVEGQRYSETGINRSRARVTALGFFERVDISTEQGSAPDRLTVYVDVTEKPTGTFQVGAGFSSIENFIATAQVQQANLFGNGQNISLQAQISGIRQLINLRFVEPYFLESRFSASIDLFDQLRAYTDFTQRSRGGALTFGYPLVVPTVNVALTYSATLDEVSTGNNSTLLGGTTNRVSAFNQLPLANLFQYGVTSSIRPSISFDTRDNRLFPTSGVYLNLSTELATKVLASENEFIRNKWTGRFYVPIWKGLVFKMNTEAGMVTSPNPAGVPIFARFFLGGILDLRGFLFRSVGPRMPLTQSTDPNSAPITNGANIGGNLMYYQNVELEFPIFDAVGLKAVLFTDLGNAWNLEGNYCDAAGGATMYPEVSPCFSIDSLLAVRTSWGFGLRWFSPLGPLRFEWGFPFKPLPYEESNRFEFTIGNFF
ncbi:MAG TPA: outer membrane protein assembly factor BamA [Polyangiaceae bacterium]|nr:outer membrane protein assembly factor BamA [Polyangiaceae bacterium]